MNTKLVLYISLAADIAIAFFKFLGAALTGSSAMFAEAVYSVIDSVSQLLLIWGVKTSKRPADSERPFGHGRELYLWSLFVSLIIFVLGGCISIFEGYTRLHHAQLAGNPLWNYLILGIAFIFNSVSLLSSLKYFNKSRKVSFWQALVKTTDTTTMIVILSDVGELFGLIIAFAGIYLSNLMRNSSLDGYASIAIGVLLLIISGFLIRKCSNLLMGETISNKFKKALIKMIELDEAVHKIKKIDSIYESPDNVLVIINTQFKNEIDMAQLHITIHTITGQIRQEFPQIKKVYFVPLPLHQSYSK